jgi:hypothetical protein
VHANAFVDAKRRENVKQNWDDHDAAAYAEKTGDKSAHNSRDSKREREEPKHLRGRVE